MKKVFLPLFLGILLTVFGCQKETHLFKLTGDIPGLSDSTVVLYGLFSVPDSVIEKIEEEEYVSLMLRKLVLVEEYELLSLGKIVTSDNEYILSVGMLGNVIVLPKEEISEKIFLKLREKKIIE